MIKFKKNEEIDIFVNTARSYLNCKWKHRGRSKNGIDCAGLVICSLQDMNYNPIDLKIYGREPFRDGLQDYAEKNFGKNVTTGITKGDILLLRFEKQPHHVAIVGDYIHGGLSLIHSSGEAGKVIETIFNEYWQERVCLVYRIRTEENELLLEQYLKELEELEEENN